MAGVLKYKFGEFEADLRAAELRKRGHRLRMQMQPQDGMVNSKESLVRRMYTSTRLMPQA